MGSRQRIECSQFLFVPDWSSQNQSDAVWPGHQRILEMKISIESTKPITENYLLDLSENKIDFKLDESL